MKEKDLLKKIKPTQLPRHLGVIMDGNGRWAKRRGLARSFGHKNAIKAVREIIKGCQKLNIPYLTLYAFSTENWSRPKAEITILMTLFSEVLSYEIKEMHKEGVRFNAIGDLKKLPKKVQKNLVKAMELTKNNTGQTLTLALNYGGKEDITQAVNSLIDAGDVPITQEKIKSALYTKDLPSVDLMIRTSGEYRISNFLLWDLAYSEFYFTDILWPDFKQETLFNAIFDFQNRERRFGKTSEQLTK